MTILIVDDRLANREYLVTLLGYGGHRLLQAADGGEALDVVRVERPDLVIADILMPTMDGYEFVRRLRADPAIAATPVIFLTAHYHEREARALADAAGVAHILTKPAEPQAVLRTVQAALGAGAPLPAATPVEEFDREHLRLLTDKVAQKADELRRANERLTALIDLGLDFGTERDPRRLLQGFCHRAREFVGARYAVVGVLDSDGLRLRHCVTSGMNAELAARLGSPAPRQGPLGDALKENCGRRLHQDGTDPAGLGLAPSFPPARAVVVAPVVSPKRAYGWLCLLDRVGAGEFSAEDERLAGILAAQVGRIYENGSLYADVLRHAAELEREVSERLRAEQRQAILLGVSQALAESAALREAAPKVLRAISSGLGWELGAIWVVDQRDHVLRCVDVVHGNAAGHAEWAALTRNLTFPPGAGLPGRVWLDSKPARVADVTADANFPRADAAARTDLDVGIAFPILFEDKVLGVVEFFSSRPHDWDDDLLQVFTGISGPLGQFMERKQAEAALRERDAQVRLLLDSTAEAIYGIDLEGNCTFANRACARLLRYANAQQLLGKHMHSLIHHSRPDGTPYPEAECRLYQPNQLGEGCHVEDEVFWRADGTSFPAEYWSYPIRDAGRIVGSVVTFLDITERRQLEAQFRGAQQRLEHVVASSPAVLFTLGVEGDDLWATWVSENLREMMGYDAAEASGMNWWGEHVHPDDLPRALAAIRQNLFAHGRVTDEYRFQHRDGPYRWVRSEMRLLRDAAGVPVEVVGSWSDITDRKNLEDQFRQAQKMEAIGRLAGGVAHDFNNLLTVINGYGEIVLQRLPADDPARELLREVVAAGDRAAGLTRQLLAFSRKAILEPRVLDLRALVAGVDNMLRRIIGEDIHMAVDADPEVGAVKADAGQIEQVLLNLVVNARDAMPQGGCLTIEVRNVELDETYAHSHPDARTGAHVLLAISDSGCGMDAATLARIGEPFFTTKGERGTGLGLATVHGIIKQSGGHVAVYSEVGVGTTFKVYIPRVAEHPASAKSHSGLTVLPRGSETVLLVEDEDGVRALARHVLEGCGYTVLEARDGADAVRVADQYSNSIDLVVSDVVMPRLGGRAVAERLAALRPGVKVLFLSGYTDDAVVRHGILEAQVAFLQKPFTPAALATKVREVLDSSGGGQREETG